MICLLRCCDLSFFWSCFWYVNLWLQPAFISVSWHMGIELLKIFSFEDNFLKRLSTDRGNGLTTEGGWFDCLCIWSISLVVLLNGRSLVQVRHI